MKKLAIILIAMAVLAGCNRQDKSRGMAEDREAKALLQGVWLNSDDESVSFHVKGDTIYYADTTSMPAYFKIVADSLVLASGTKYGIVKQTPHLFWFNNQNGDVVKLQKSDNPEDSTEFVHDTPKVVTYTHQVKTDSVVMYGGERYHWYIAINPTKYKVQKRAYNEDGLEVENVYYDNIMHVSVFSGARKLFSTDFRKQLYASKIPQQFLSQSVLSNMEFTGVDAKGFHFVATICIPDGASCYKAENIVSFSGELTTTLLEY